MATPSPKSPKMTESLEHLFGRSTHIQNDTCAYCNGPATEFENALSIKEYTISGMCQNCQTETFFAPTYAEIRELDREQLIAEINANTQ